MKVALICLLSLVAYAEDVGVSVKTSAITHTMLNRAVEKCTDTQLTAAQIDALAATPVTLVAAPGASLSYEVTGVFLQTKPGTAYVGTGTMYIRYVSGASVVTGLPNARLTTTTRDSYWAPPIAVQPVDNTGIEAAMASDLSAGTGTMALRVCYKTLSTDPDAY